MANRKHRKNLIFVSSKVPEVPRASLSGTSPIFTQSDLQANTFKVAKRANKHDKRLPLLPASAAIAKDSAATENDTEAHRTFSSLLVEAHRDDRSAASVSGPATASADDRSGGEESNKKAIVAASTSSRPQSLQIRKRRSPSSADKLDATHNATIDDSLGLALGRLRDASRTASSSTPPLDTTTGNEPTDWANLPTAQGTPQTRPGTNSPNTELHLARNSSNAETSVQTATFVTGTRPKLVDVRGKKPLSSAPTSDIPSSTASVVLPQHVREASDSTNPSSGYAEPDSSDDSFRQSSGATSVGSQDASAALGFKPQVDKNGPIAIRDFSNGYTNDKNVRPTQERSSEQSRSSPEEPPSTETSSPLKSQTSKEVQPWPEWSAIGQASPPKRLSTGVSLFPDSPKPTVGLPALRPARQLKETARSVKDRFAPTGPRPTNRLDRFNIRSKNEDVSFAPGEKAQLESTIERLENKAKEYQQGIGRYNVQADNHKRTIFELEKKNGLLKEELAIAKRSKAGSLKDSVKLAEQEHHAQTELEKALERVDQISRYEDGSLNAQHQVIQAQKDYIRLTNQRCRTLEGKVQEFEEHPLLETNKALNAELVWTQKKSLQRQRVVEVKDAELARINAVATEHRKTSRAQVETAEKLTNAFNKTGTKYLAERNRQTWIAEDRGEKIQQLKAELKSYRDGHRESEFLLHDDHFAILNDDAAFKESESSSQEPDTLPNDEAKQPKDATRRVQGLEVSLRETDRQLEDRTSLLHQVSEATIRRLDGDDEELRLKQGRNEHLMAIIEHKDEVIGEQYERIESLVNAGPETEAASQQPDNEWKATTNAGSRTQPRHLPPMTYHPHVATAVESSTVPDPAQPCNSLSVAPAQPPIGTGRGGVQPPIGTGRGGLQPPFGTGRVHRPRPTSSPTTEDAGPLLPTLSNFEGRTLQEDEETFDSRGRAGQRFYRAGSPLERNELRQLSAVVSDGKKTGPDFAVRGYLRISEDGTRVSTSAGVIKESPFPPASAADGEDSGVVREVVVSEDFSGGSGCVVIRRRRC